MLQRLIAQIAGGAGRPAPNVAPAVRRPMPIGPARDPREAQMLVNQRTALSRPGRMPGSGYGR